jgi:hypothetical protein
MDVVDARALAVRAAGAVLQYLKCQCRWRVVEDDDVETIGCDVSGKSPDYAAQARSCINASGGRIDQNRHIDVAIGAGAPGCLGSEKESGMDLRQRFCGVGDGAQ